MASKTLVGFTNWPVVNGQGRYKFIGIGLVISNVSAVKNLISNTNDNFIWRTGKKCELNWKLSKRLLNESVLDILQTVSEQKCA